MEKVTLSEAARKIQGYWNPLVLGELNGQSIKLTRFKGEFDWHHHEEEDEAFLVVEGEISIEFQDRKVLLHTGELLIVPKKVEHRPVAHDDALVLLFEPNATVNTGNVITEKTNRNLNRYDSHESQ